MSAYESVVDTMFLVKASSNICRISWAMLQEYFCLHSYAVYRWILLKVGSSVEEHHPEI